MGLGNALARCEYCKTHGTDTCCANGTPCSTPVASSTTVAGTTSGAVATPPSSAAVTPTPTESKSTSPIAGLSMAAFGGVIAGAAVLLLLIIAMCICCMRRKKTNNQGNGGSKNLSRQMSNSSARYNISSPKIQEEGFGASSVAAIPSAHIPMTALPSLSAPEPIVAVGAGAVATGAPKAAGKQSYCQALYPYQASMADELDLNPGDIVNVQKVFDDGWAVGVNMNSGSEGAFPVVCVMFVDESALDDDFEDVNMHSMTPMSVREDDATGGRNSPRSSLPSRSSSPVHLPRRNSSMIRDSTLLPGTSSSPMSSSPLAGNAGGRSTPPVRDTMMSDASSINRWWDGEGRK
ncbi:hypothetical protein BGZ52_003118 [Haplosporangium bisporale]|nr:hypothetical protein BGZ52_003118 [Haplosporangium bisporale]